METILKMLKINLAYRQGETIAIISQEGSSKKFLDSVKLAKTIFQTLKENNFNVELISYKPTKEQNGVDVIKEVYEKIGKKDIVLMPTAYSLTHTNFRKEQTKKGTRIASLPGATLEMFSKKGPMDLDYFLLAEKTKILAERLRGCQEVRITGEKTDLIVKFNPKLVHEDNGLLINPGDKGNLPAGEVFTVPIDAEGYFTVPSGWGGQKPLQKESTFYLKKGKFVHVEEEVKKLFFSKKGYDILAELGIGTNPNVTVEYLQKKGWSTLLAEKIIGSVHLANGNNFSFGGKNNVDIHIDWVIPNVKIEFLREINPLL